MEMLSVTRTEYSRKAHKKSYGEEISIEEAREMASRIRLLHEVPEQAVTEYRSIAVVTILHGPRRADDHEAFAGFRRFLEPGIEPLSYRRRHRHQPSRPPLTNSRPGRPAPTLGTGTFDTGVDHAAPHCRPRLHHHLSGGRCIGCTDIYLGMRQPHCQRGSPRFFCAVPFGRYSRRQLFANAINAASRVAS
jgi:hypothetical protein